MKSLVVTSPLNAEFRELEEIRPVGSEVLIRVKRVGICGSDIHIYRGSNPFTKYPRVIGHEIAGEVILIGSDVTRFQVGDRVVVNPVLNCGVCDTCLRNHSNVCSNLEVLGVHQDGGFASQIKVKEENVYSVSKNLSWDQAVLVEPFSVGANICTLLQIDKHDRVLIIGAGVIGTVALMVCKMLGAQVIISDIDDDTLTNAEKNGADFVVNSSSRDIKDAVDHFTDNCGATAIIDAACIPSLFQVILECAAPGGRVGILGFSQKMSSINQFEITRKELSIFGSRLNNKRFPMVIEWFEKEMLKPELLIKDRFPFSESLEVINSLSSNKSSPGKTIITFDS